jgi:uncharacterized lipoprotein YajG
MNINNRKRIMKKLWLLILSALLIGCCNESGKVETKVEKDSWVMEFNPNNSYNFKKIYVKDKRGFTHEILTATSGSTYGGVSLLELSVYKDGKAEETN